MARAHTGTSFFRQQSWRVLLSPPDSGVANMAIDEALMRYAARHREGVLRIYQWRAPTLSIGRHQRARDAYDPDIARALGVSLVRRLTGGRALLHWHEVTYSVAVPVSNAPLSEGYQAINDLLLDALRSLGVAASLAPAGDPLGPPASAPCFERPAAGEILVGGRKLVGSAQVRDAGAMLQHGSILLADDQQWVTKLAARPGGRVAIAATLTEALGREPSFDDVAAALQASLRSRCGHDPGPVEPADVAADRVALVTHYASDDWTWRR